MTGSMKDRRRAVGLLAALLALALLGPRAEAGKMSYEITDLGTLPGNDSSFAVDINNSGQVVGGSVSNGGGGGTDRAFVYSDGRMTALDKLRSPSFNNGIAINDTGQIVGESRDIDQMHFYQVDGGGVTDVGQSSMAGLPVAVNNVGQVAGYDGPDGSRSFIYGNGTQTNLGNLKMGVGRTAIMAADVNNAGQVVGRHMYEVGPDHQTRYAPFIYSDGKLVDLGRIGLVGSSANAINDAGQVVGGWTLGPDSHAFLYDNGVVSDLGTIGGLISTATDINKFGQIVGESDTDDGGNIHAFLDQNGTMIDLNDFLPPETSWTLQSASGINDAGQIVGTMWDGRSHHAYLLTPTTVPEPATVVILSIGVFAFGMRKTCSLWHAS